MNKKIFFLFIFLYFTRIIFSKEIRYNLYIDLNIQIYKNNKKKIFTEYEKHIKQISFSNNSEKIVSNLFNYKNIFFKMKKNKTEFLIYLNNFYKNYNFLTYHDHLIFNSNFNIQSLNININYMRNKVQEFKCSILFLYHYRIKKFISFFSWGSGINYNIFTSTLNNSLSENNVLNIDNKYKYFYEQKNSITNKFFFLLLSKYMHFLIQKQ